MVRPMRAHHGIFLFEVGANAYRDRFLAGGEVHLAGNRSGPDIKCQSFLDLGRKLAFQIDVGHGFFIVANLQHGFIHPEHFFLASLHVHLL